MCMIDMDSLITFKEINSYSSSTIYDGYGLPDDFRDQKPFLSYRAYHTVERFFCVAASANFFSVHQLVSIMKKVP